MIRWDNSDYLAHYGTKGHSGRYPPGSGKNPKTGPRAHNSSARTMPRGASAFRVIANPGTYRGLTAKRDAMFVSNTYSDAVKWGRYFSKGKKKPDYPMAAYVAKKDLKIMSSSQAADMLIHDVLSRKNMNDVKMSQVNYLLDRINRVYGEGTFDMSTRYKDLNNTNVKFRKEGKGTRKRKMPAAEYLVSTSITSGSLAGQELIKKAMKQKYQVIEDSFGKTVSENPYIVLKPNKNLIPVKDGMYDLEAAAKDEKNKVRYNKKHRR